MEKSANEETNERSIVVSDNSRSIESSSDSRGSLSASLPHRTMAELMKRCMQGDLDERDLDSNNKSLTNQVRSK